MSTWLGVIAETQGREEFWTVAKALGAEKLAAPAGGWALIDCGHDFGGTFTFAAALAEKASCRVMAFVVQTNSDAHELAAFEQNRCVRKLWYTRDYGGWVTVEGTPQPWERAYFFGGDDLLWDDTSEEDLARFETAKKAGDVTPVIELAHPSSTAPMHRVCRHFELDGNVMHGRWKKPSFWSRLFT